MTGEKYLALDYWEPNPVLGPEQERRCRNMCGVIRFPSPQACDRRRKIVSTVFPSRAAPAQAFGGKEQVGSHHVHQRTFVLPDANHFFFITAPAAPLFPACGHGGNSTPSTGSAWV